MVPKPSFILTCLLLVSSSHFFLHSQSRPEVIVSVTHQEQVLYAGVDNYFSVVAQQRGPVSLEQLDACFFPWMYSEGHPPIPMKIEEKYGWFILHPDSIGQVILPVRLENQIDSVKLRVKPIPVEGYLSRYKGDRDEQIPAGEMRAQQGLFAYVNCCGFDARCKVEEFQVVRIPKNSPARRAFNKGARFEGQALELIHQAAPGDIYLFRKIFYRCPGHSFPQKLRDMIFEVK